MAQTNRAKTYASLTWQVKAAVKYALSVGYRHIDCAAIYGNETEIGEALKENVGPSKVRTGATVGQVRDLRGWG